jgi:hypothetical protein
MNSVNPFAHSFLYREFPEYYRWDRTDKEWLRRKQRMQISRMVFVCPIEGERYYLRVLLNHVRGATSFNDLKTIGIALTSFHYYFSPSISSCVWWYITKTLYALCLIIYFYIICFVSTITDLIEHDDIFRWLYICHIPRGM